MRIIAPALALAGLVVVACSGRGDPAHDTGESAYTSDAGAADSASQPACSLVYWDWVRHTLQPKLARPIGEVSEAQMLALVATRPAAEETANAYSECWTPIFGKYFSGDALYRLHNAGVAYIDSRSPDYLSYPRSPTRAAVASFR